MAFGEVVSIQQWNPFGETLRLMQCDLECVFVEPYFIQLSACQYCLCLFTDLSYQIFNLFHILTTIYGEISPYDRH